jgi:hypothetical protein
MQRAVELDPLSLIVNSDLGYALFLARRDDDALAQYQKVAAMDRTFVPLRAHLTQYYLSKRMYDDYLQEAGVAPIGDFGRTTHAPLWRRCCSRGCCGRLWLA